MAYCTLRPGVGKRKPEFWKTKILLFLDEWPTWFPAPDRPAWYWIPPTRNGSCVTQPAHPTRSTPPTRPTRCVALRPSKAATQRNANHVFRYPSSSGAMGYRSGFPGQHFSPGRISPGNPSPGKRLFFYVCFFIFLCRVFGNLYSVNTSKNRKKS